VILEPINDADCLGQLTTIARELSSTTLIRAVAQHLGTRENVILWLQSKPQTDDDGKELVRFIKCDVPQRVRLLADDPNCVERATDAMMLLEALEQMNMTGASGRALGTVDQPVRHTGLVEKRGTRWYAVDLFPRRNGSRNFDWSSFGVSALKGVHQYAGKPILKFYGLGSVADTIGEQEDKLGPKPSEKKSAPPSGPKAQQPAATGGGSGAAATMALNLGKGGKGNAEKETRKPELGGTSQGAAGAVGGGFTGAFGALTRSAAGGDRDSHDQRTQAQRFSGWWGVQ